MNKMKTYTYCILRYVHDTTTGEFVNVGVALYAPEARYLSAVCRSTYGRLSKVFPGVNPDHFKSLMRHIQRRFEELGERVGTELPLERIGTVEALARRVVPVDDSALQWAPVGSGRAADPAAALEQLFDRMVMRYEDKSSKERRTEEDVWRHFKKNLEAKQLLSYFKPGKVGVLDDEIEFDHTWKNGVLHCLEPVSFDLKTADSIKDKAHRWLGRLTSVAESEEKFRLYFLVGEPQDDKLEGAFDNAMSILSKSPVEIDIYRERQEEELCDRLAREVREHNDSIVSD